MVTLTSLESKYSSCYWFLPLFLINYVYRWILQICSTRCPSSLAINANCLQKENIQNFTNFWLSCLEISRSELKAIFLLLLFPVYISNLQTWFPGASYSRSLTGFCMKPIYFSFFFLLLVVADSRRK